MNLIVRKFKKEDLSQVLEMVREMVLYHNQLDPFYRTPADMKNLSKNISGWLKERRERVLVAEQDGKIIGYVRGSIGRRPYYVREREVVVLIDDLFVKKTHRRQKAGEQLLKELFHWFSEKKATTAMLYVDARNESAIKFWKKMGFVEFTLRMKKSLL